MANLSALIIAVVVSVTAGAGASTLVDRGIFPDLDARASLKLPAPDEVRAPRLRLAPRQDVLVLFDGDYPLAAFALSGKAPASSGTFGALSRLLPAPEVRALSAWFTPASPVEPLAGTADADGDGIPDQLDVLYGARKLAANRAVYTEGYVPMKYPGGDVPRGQGVCSDTIVRALRNAGHDLQRLVAEDIRRAPNAYPKVRKPNTSIDHRRVKNLLRWFQRHARAIASAEPVRAGEIVFLDTFPGRPGPDHVGIVSDRRAPTGGPLVINNWTVGYVEQDMELLSFVPVTHRFRLP
jgi:uncharacterized protein